MKTALFSILVLLATFAAFGEKMYFKSNAIGMKMEQTPPDRKAREEYFLETERVENTELRVLFSDGKEVRRWEISYYEKEIKREETEYKGKEIQKRLTYDPLGRLTEELSYRNGEPLSRFLNIYTGKDHSATEAYNGKDELLYRESYALTRDGSLRQISRTYPDGRKQVSSYSIFSAKLLQESFQNGDALLLSRFDDAGHLLYTEVWDKETLKSRILYAYNEGSSTAKSETEEILAEKKTITRLFDADGRLTEETTAVAELQTESAEYTWASGKKTAAVRRSGKGQEEWKYAYDKDGVLAQEEYFLKGRLEKITYYLSDNEYREEIYWDGQVSVKLHYRDSEKIKEEFYKDGKLIREKDLVKNEE